MRAESFYNLATNIDDMDKELSYSPRLITNYGGVSLHKQSHGESVGKCPRSHGAVTENKKSFCGFDKSCGFAIWQENSHHSDVVAENSFTKSMLTLLVYKKFCL